VTANSLPSRLLRVASLLAGSVAGAVESGCLRNFLRFPVLVASSLGLSCNAREQEPVISVLVVAPAPESAAALSEPRGYVLASDPDVLPKPGTKLIFRTKSWLEKGRMVYITPGHVRSYADSTTSLSVIEEEIVSAGKFKRLQVTDDFEQLLDGKPATGRPPASTLVGVPITFTQVDGKWTAAMDTGVPDEAQRKKMDKDLVSLETPSSARILGTGPRKVGETWTVTGKDLPFAARWPVATGTLELTFKGIEMHTGRECARITGHMDLQAAEIPGPTGLKLHLQGEISMLRTLDDFVPFEWDFKGTMEKSSWTPGKGRTLETGESTNEMRAEVQP